MRVACIKFDDPKVDLERVAEACLVFSPQLSISSEGALFIEIGKCKNILSEDEFLEEVKKLLGKFGLKATVAIGFDVAHALALATYGPKQSSNEEIVSIFDFPIEGIRELSFPYGCDEDTERNLNRMTQAMNDLGIKHVGQFAKIPAHEFPSRFGKLGLLCRQRVEHGAEELWQNWKPKEKVTESMQLDYGQTCASLEPLIFLSKQLLDRMFLRLHGLGFAMNSLSMELRFEKLSTVKNPVRKWKIEFMLPQSSVKTVLSILMERWQRDFSTQKLEAEIVWIAFEATDTSVAFDGQKNFFSYIDEDGEKLNAIMSHLSECIGKEKVFQAALTEDRFPEKSWRRFNKWVASDVEIKHAYPERPLRLLSRPLKMEVTAGKLFLNGRGFSTMDWSQVERISGHWLDGLEIRNYYKVDIKDGPPLWVFQDPQDQFFLHGYYE